MELTIDFIADNFQMINELYFNNELETPRFEITHVKSYLGQYHWQYDMFGEFMDSVIRISDMFDRTEEDIINTIAHETIHLYIRQHHIKDTRPHHGKVFYSIAARKRMTYMACFLIIRSTVISIWAKKIRNIIFTARMMAIWICTSWVEKN